MRFETLFCKALFLDGSGSGLICVHGAHGMERHLDGFVEASRCDGSLLRNTSELPSLINFF